MSGSPESMPQLRTKASPAEQQKEAALITEDLTQFAMLSFFVNTKLHKNDKFRDLRAANPYHTASGQFPKLISS